MEALVAGAALGAAFELLFKAVILATLRIADYNSDLNRLKQTLYSIKPVIDDIQKFNKILNRPPNETDMFIDRLKEGEKLVLKCSKVSDLEKKVNEIFTIMKGCKISGEVMDDGGSLVVLNKISDCEQIKDLGERRRIWIKGRLVEQTLINRKGITVWEDNATLPIIPFSSNGSDEPMFPTSISDEHASLYLGLEDDASSQPWSDYVI